MGVETVALRFEPAFAPQTRRRRSIAVRPATTVVDIYAGLLLWITRGRRKAIENYSSERPGLPAIHDLAPDNHTPPSPDLNAILMASILGRQDSRGGGLQATQIKNFYVQPSATRLLSRPRLCHLISGRPCRRLMRKHSRLSDRLTAAG